MDSSTTTNSTSGYFSKCYNYTKNTAKNVFTKEWREKNINKHYVMWFFGIICLLIGLIGFILISGAQTGSSDTAGCGCLVKACTGGSEDGEINVTTEVVSEFLAILFLVVGLGLCVYAWALSDISTKLMNAGQYTAALTINAAKGMMPNAKKEAEMADLSNEMKDNPGFFQKMFGGAKQEGVKEAQAKLLADKSDSDDEQADNSKPKTK